MGVGKRNLGRVKVSVISGRPVRSGLVKKLKKSSRCLKTAGAAAFRLLAACGGAGWFTQSRRISRRLVTATAYYTCKPEKEFQRGSSRLSVCHYMMSSYLVKDVRATDEGMFIPAALILGTQGTAGT